MSVNNSSESNSGPIQCLTGSQSTDDENETHNQKLKFIG